MLTFARDINGTKKRFFEDTLKRAGSTIIINGVEIQALIKQVKDTSVGEDKFEIYIPIEVTVNALDTFVWNGKEYLIKVANVWESIYTRCLANPLYQTINIKYNNYPIWQFKVCPTDESVTINDSNTNIAYAKMSSIIYLKRDDTSKLIKRGTRFFLYGTVYKIYGITYANSSVLILYCEADSILNTDDEENQIADNSSIVPSGMCYTITSTSGINGSIAPLGETVVQLGASRVFTFTASENYMLDKVLVDGEEVQIVNSQYTFENVTANHTIDVTFKAIPVNTYSIEATVIGNGSITPLGTTILNVGDTQTYTITSDEGYKVSYVKVDNELVELEGNTYTFENVTSNHTIEVLFEACVIYYANIKCGYNGNLRVDDTIIGEGKTVNVSIKEESNTVLEIIPNQGYKLKSVTQSTEDYTSLVVDNQLVLTDTMLLYASITPITVSFKK